MIGESEKIKRMLYPLLNPEPNSIRNPLPLLSNNATLGKIDGVMVIPRLVLIMEK